MADEPRRSGRATKGQYTKDRDIAEESTTKKKGRGKATKAAKPVEEEEEEEQDEVIRCICGEYEEEEDNPRSMICCDNCNAWQHNMCMGLAEDFTPETYYCEQCRPEDHKELLEAIKRGETPWVEALKQRLAAEGEKGPKKRGRKGRKSGNAVPPQGRVDHGKVETPKPSGQKRKAEETPTAELKTKKVRGTPAAENGATEASQGRKASTPTRQPSQPQTDQEMETKAETTLLDIKSLTNTTRKGAANSLIKLFTDQMKDAVKSGTYKVAARANLQDEGTQLGLQVERALYQVVQQGTGEPGDVYKSQLRAISFNVKKNPALGERIISGDISPEKLASMDAKNMASEEQQKKDAALKEEMDKQHTLTHEQGPRIRRTHKGEEYIDEAHQVAAESTTSKTPIRRQSNIDQSAESKESESADKSKKGRQPLSVNTQAKGKPPTDLRRKSSSNFDIDKVWSGVHGSPDGETPRLSDAPHHGSPPPMNAATGTDPDIDNLLKDEENESEPYSPRDFNEEGVVWRGSVNGGNLGRFRGIAKFAAGAKPEADTLRLTWEKVIPAEIVIHGRIQPQKADDYLCGLQYSNSSDLIVVSMPEPRDRDDLEGFEKLFKYFKTKGRYGVGMQHENPAIKDIYLLPMDAGQPLPTVMKAIETNFPDPVIERMILVPIVIKNSELPHNVDAASQSIMSPSLGPPVAQTPITPQESHREIPPLPQGEAISQTQPPNGAPQPPIHQSPALHQGHWSPTPQQAPPPPIPSQIPAMPPNPTPAASAAYRILGPQLANSAAVQQLLRSAPTVGDNEMRIVHDCIKENAQAASDLSVLTRMLQVKSAQSKESQAQARSQSQALEQKALESNALTSGGASTQGQASA